MSKNVQAELENGTLTIRVDITKDLGPSKSGKTTIVATTEGALDIQGIKVNLNVYKPKG